MSPNLQPEPPLVQIEAIPSSFITRYLQEEADPQLSTKCPLLEAASLCHCKSSSADFLFQLDLVPYGMPSQH